MLISLNIIIFVIININILNMLKELFLPLYEKGFNDVEIAKQLNSSPQTIGRIRNSLNLPKRFSIHKHESIISELSLQNLTNSEISRRIGISITQVRSIREQLQLPESPWKQTQFNNNDERIKGNMIVRSKTRAKKYNLEFNIDLYDIELPEYCPLLNIKLDYTTKNKCSSNTASLDRIDNTKGYIKGNIMTISYLANTMKNNSTLEQLQTFCKNTLQILKPYFNEI